MSLQLPTVPSVPKQTAEVAKRAFRRGNRYTLMRDQLGEFYPDADLAHLDAVRGRPGEAPWQLALVRVFQFAEGRSDEQAAKCVRSRIDWKYALSRELEDSGFAASVLREFRSHLVAGKAETKLLDLMRERFQQAGYLKERGRQRTDATYVLAAVRDLNWLGYKVHLTESWDEEAPHLITHVLTTPATTPRF